MYTAEKLEIHVADHCNMDCVGCSHESPFMPHRIEDPDKMERSLSRLWPHYDTPLIVLLGGEPLLHPRIDDVVAAVRKQTDAGIRLRTNGTILEDQSHRLSGVDEVYISRYPDADISSADTLQSIAAETDTEITIHEVSHFRWEHVAPRKDHGLTERIFDTCKIYHQWNCHTLRGGKLYPCPPAGTWAAENHEFVDLLSDQTDVEERLGAILDRDIPFETCRECLGSAGERLEHRTGWRETEEEPPADPVDYDYLSELEDDIEAYNGCYEYDREFLPDGTVREIHR
jgi:hypothetical protein